MIVEIDNKSGFCFGVKNAINKAEEALGKGDILYSLGSIVHNEHEVERLNNIGLKTINHEEFFKLKDCRVLIRAHGEPPAIYEYARLNNITIIDATCPVVLKLQQRVKKAGESMQKEDGQIIIFGHEGHAEVVGLVGQIESSAIVIENPEDIGSIDFSKPIEIFSQTTKSVEEFRKLSDEIVKQSGKRLEAHDTICRQVSNRAPHLADFAGRFDLVVFVGGKQSSNAQVLFNVCKKKNERTFFISGTDELKSTWFSGINTVGVCGATSTPQWLMEQVARKIEEF